MTFLHTSNGRVDIEIKNAIPILIIPKKVEDFDAKLMKHTWGLYVGNNAMLMKDIKGHLNK